MTAEDNNVLKPAEAIVGIAHRPITVDGRNAVSVAYVAGGMSTGVADGSAEADGGVGGVVIPLGAYLADGDRLKFVPNWTVLAVAAAPLVALAIWRLTRR